MKGYVLHSETEHRFLEQRPYDGAWTWLAAFSRYATVFSKAAAQAMATRLRAEGQDVTVLEDYDRRAPDVFDDSDREPPDADGESYRGSESAAAQQDAQAEAWKLK
jgi:hypothetical protein